jgi:hypothetical protein
VFLSNSIKIKKTPLISAKKPMIRCRYKGGHFEITNFIYFEYIRGISEAAGGAAALPDCIEKTQRKLRMLCECHIEIIKKISQRGLYVSLTEKNLRSLWVVS